MRPSRRDFLKLTSALVLAGTGSCRWPEEPADERSEIHVLRADDLLSLRFRFHNLRIVHHRGQPPSLVRVREGEEARLVVEFPGQHVAEQVFPEGESPPAPPVTSRLAGPSRLVFKLSPDTDHVPLTLESLLDWRGWVASLAPDGRGPGVASPTAESTAIELPSRLLLSPQDGGRWAHAFHPVTHKGRTELWHTRLASSDTALPEVKVLWSPDDADPSSGRVRTSLSAEDRRDLVGRSATARTLVLSPMGGWLDVHGAWETDGPSSLEKWHHVATAGQDQKVVVQRAGGFLFPFGHRAALLKVTERTSETVDGRSVGYLRQRYFVVVKQATVEYRHGHMAFRAITVLDRLTSSLQLPVAPGPEDPEPFWIETGTDEPFLFRLRAEDWAGRSLVLAAPAVFLPKAGDPGAALDRYEKAGEDRRVRPMQSQSAAVVRFHPEGDRDTGPEGDPGTDGWGEPLPHPRSQGDTTLNLLRVGFTADPSTRADDGPPFSPRTSTFQARVPSLEPYLKDDVNQGWFTLVDPDTEDNLGEVFAEADPGRGDPPIPLYFDEQSDRCGGVATPSFDVAGLSRVRGPVGDTAPLYRGGEFDPKSYFNTERARLLGGLPLAELLAPPPEEEGGSPAIPRISLSLARKQPSKDEGPAATAYWEAALGLAWSIPLESSAPKTFSFIALGAGSKTRLNLGVRLTRRLGAQAPDTKPEGGGSESSDKKGGPGVDWSVSGSVTEFALKMNAGDLGTLEIGFDHLTLKLSTPKTKIKDGQETKTGGAEIDYRLSHVHGEGPLLFIDVLLALITHRPPLPELPESEASLAYPATLPGVEGADVSVTLGPLQAPDTTWGKFKVTNIAATVGVGFFFTGQPPLFTLRLASQDKPLTLMAGTWGGLAHVGLNFSGKALTGFQAALGLVYRLEADIAGGKAKIEGSLTCTFTYLLTDGDPEHRVDMVLRVVGEVTIFGLVEVYLSFMAAGTWQDGAWFFRTEVTARVRIGFFAVTVSYGFTYRISGGSGDQLALAGSGRLDSARVTEGEWLAYDAAFARA